jgi:hypothetical protein
MDETYEIDVGEILPGDPGYGWTYYSDGTAISPEGVYYYEGEEVYDPSSQGGDIWNWLSNAGGSLASGLKTAFTDPKTGGVNTRALAGVAGGLYGLYQANQPQEKTGYQGGIPKYDAIREGVQGSQYDPNRRPGSGGQRYFSDVRYAKEGEGEAARAAAKEEAAGLEALNRANLAREERRSPTAEAVAKAEESAKVNEGTDASKVVETVPVPKYAHGGITTLAKGGAPRYLSGATDGMADKIPAQIDGKQEARLSHGEFVVSADVVSALGGGNSEAGAQRLYEMMDRIRTAAHGKKQQMRPVNPAKVLPK